jgi:hypothetical protein
MELNKTISKFCPSEITDNVIIALKKEGRTKEYMNNLIDELHEKKTTLTVGDITELKLAKQRISKHYETNGY